MQHDLVATGFANALLDPAIGKPASIRGPMVKASDKRFNVYRNNVAYSLVEALGQNYPAVKAQCGEARFNDAARLYLAENPPRTKIMFELGTGFADWLDNFAPAREQTPFLADLARLERAWLSAYHAEDSAVLDAASLATISPEALGSIRFTKHPASFVICSAFPICTMLESARLAKELGNFTQPQNVLVTRPVYEVEVRLLTDATADFLTRILSGESLEDAASTAQKMHFDFDLSSALGLLLQSGAAAAVH